MLLSYPVVCLPAKKFADLSEEKVKEIVSSLLDFSEFHTVLPFRHLNCYNEKVEFAANMVADTRLCFEFADVDSLLGGMRVRIGSKRSYWFVPWHRADGIYGVCYLLRGRNASRQRWDTLSAIETRRCGGMQGFVSGVNCMAIADGLLSMIDELDDACKETDTFVRPLLVDAREVVKSAKELCLYIDWVKTIDIRPRGENENKEPVAVDDSDEHKEPVVSDNGDDDGDDSDYEDEDEEEYAEPEQGSRKRKRADRETQDGSPAKRSKN